MQGKESRRNRPEEKNYSRHLYKAHIVAARFRFKSCGVSKAGAKLGSLRILHTLTVARCIITVLKVYMTMIFNSFSR